jgi:hypothetical protein
MAGKTFHGVGGDLDGESPTLGPEGTASPAEDGGDGYSEAYSGPTIVDDAKIAESLKRLRSLDQPLNSSPGTLIGISAPVIEGVTPPVLTTPVVTTPVVDPPSSEPTRLDDRPASALVVPPLGRPTAVGHSIGPNVITHQPPPQIDPMRGTMFGHSIHLPDVGAPEVNLDDISSSGQVVVPRPSPEEMKPFLPGAPDRTAPERPAEPASSPPPKRDPKRPPLAATQVVNVQAFKRAELFPEPESKSTEVVSGMHQRVRGRTAFLVVAIASAAGVVFAWMYSHDNNLPLTLPPANPPPVLPTPAQMLAPRPVAPPPETPRPEVIPPATDEAKARAEETADQSAASPTPTTDTPKPSSRRERRRTASGTLFAPPGEAPGARVAETPEARPPEVKVNETKPEETRPVEPKLGDAKAEPKVVEPKVVETKAAEAGEGKTELKAESKPPGKKGNKKSATDEDPDGTMAPSD